MTVTDNLYLFAEDEMMYQVGKEMKSFKILFLCLFLCPILVESFTFPGDWHKIRQMMKARLDKQELHSQLVILLIITFLSVDFGHFPQTLSMTCNITPVYKMHTKITSSFLTLFLHT